VERLKLVTPAMEVSNWKR